MALQLKPASPPLSRSKPFSWDEFPSSPEAYLSPISISSPPVSQLPAKDMKIFGASPLQAEYSNGIVRCNTCRKPVLRSCVVEHLENCKKIMAMATSPSKKGVKLNEPSGKKAGAKRKAEDEVEGAEGPNKKKKPAPKVTKGRKGGPVDYDKQCGVINDKGLPCSRSLTCKSHSMGAKRAVAGRSRAYDELLLDWQREHNPNFVEPVKRETKKEKKEKRDKEREEKKKIMDAKKAAAALAGGKKKKGGVAPPKADEGEEPAEEDVDSEVELDAMVQSVQAAASAGVIAVPMATYEEIYVGSWFVQRRERLRCCRDQIYGALMGGRGGIGTVPSMVRQ